MSNGLTKTGTGGAETASKQPVFLPNTDIWETKDQLVLVAEIPGADPESVEVSVDRDVLQISARSRMAPPTGHSLIHAEYRDGDYQRSFTLPATIDAGRIEATVKDGLLKLVLPKVAPPPARRVAIKVE